MNTKGMMKVALPTGKRVHHLHDGAPRCGGGRHGKRGLWQTEMSEVTCQRCMKLVAHDCERESQQKAQADAPVKSERRNPKTKGAIHDA